MGDIPPRPAGAERDATRLYSVADATWNDIGLWAHRCSTCGDTPTYFRWTGRRWWCLCVTCLVPHLDRNT